MDGQPILFLTIVITATVCLEIPHVQFTQCNVGQSVNHGHRLLYLTYMYMVLLVQLIHTYWNDFLSKNGHFFHRSGATRQFARAVISEGLSFSATERFTNLQGLTTWHLELQTQWIPNFRNISLLTLLSITNLYIPTIPK